MEAAAVEIPLAVYTPKWVAASLREGWGGTEAPFAQTRRAAVLFLDIAGFTSISERSSRLGARGAEELSDTLNSCFTALIEVLDSHGGDVAAFAGDGLIALWEGDHASRATEVASHCGLALQQALKKWGQAGQAELQQRIAIETGDVNLCRLGGFNGEWHHVVVGPPIERVGAAYRKAAAGDVILCQSARTVVPSCQGEMLGDLFRLKLLTEPIPIPRLAEEVRSPPGLERFGPRIVADRISHGGRRWLAEFRNLTIVYVNLGAAGSGTDLLGTLQQCVVPIQRISAQLEGTIYDVLMDDKGISVILAFGLPPLAHQDDSFRALEAALAIHREMKSSGMPTSIGVASGRLFCGDYGGRSRRSYCIIGPAMNLASRLMEAAEGDLYCDTNTASAIKGRGFSVLAGLHLKGFEGAVPAFRPVDVEGHLPDHHVRGPTSPLIGRNKEREALREAVHGLEGGQGGLVVIDGEAGIGKSRLLDDLAREAEASGCCVIQSFASSIEKSTPYFAWRTALRRLLDEKAGTDLPSSHDRLAAALGDRARLLTWMPLLNDIVPLGVAPTVLTDHITGSARAASIEELMVALIQGSAEGRKTLLVFDDLHWFDGASMALLAAVSRRIPQLLVIVSRRPAESTNPYDALPSDLPRTTIRLDELSRESVSQLIGERLRVNQPPSDLIDFVHRRAGGNPFYCEELLLALRDTGGIIVKRGVVEVSESVASGQHRVLSTSLEGAIVGRLDTLQQTDQTILKIASAVDVPFSAAMLRSVYPDDVPPGQIAAVLDRLAAHDFLRVQPSDAGAIYEFRHAITQQVVYDLLPYAQRRPLHRAIATHIEDANDGRLEPLYARLAQHWQLADELPIAIGYLERAGEQALRNYANFDAIRYLRKAFELAPRAGASVDGVRQSNWETILGDAYHELADFTEASAHYGRAMQLLGYQLPALRVQAMRSLFGNLARQLSHRIWLASPETMPPPKRQELQRIAHIYERLSEEYFFLNDSLLVLNGTLASLNLAELSGSTAETVNGYNALALGLGMSGLVRPAHSYNRRALRLARQHGTIPDLARANLVGGVLAAGLGEWDFADRCAEQATQLYRQLGDRARWQNTQTMAIFVALLRGKIAVAEDLLAELSTTLTTASTQVRAWSLCARVFIDTLRGIGDEASLKELRTIADARQVRADRLLCLGILASAYVRRGDSEKATEAAQLGLAVLRECNVVWAAYSYGAAGVVETLLTCWERALSGKPSDHAAAATAQAASRLLDRVARTSPVCRPRALLLRGRVLSLSGRLVQAQRYWRCAAGVAEALRMPYETGLSLYAIGSSSESGPERTKDLKRSLEIFEQLGATDDLARVRRAIAA